MQHRHAPTVVVLMAGMMLHSTYTLVDSHMTYTSSRQSDVCTNTSGRCVGCPLPSGGTFSTCAGGGAIPDSALGLTEVVWIGPESRHVYLGSPSIVKVNMTGGRARWLTSHDFFGVTTLNATTQILGTDATVADPPCCPATFSLLSTVQPMYWATLFVPPNASPGDVYIFGTSSDGRSEPSPGSLGSGGADCRDVVIAKSSDGGTTWTPPSVLFPCVGGTGYHTAPTPILVDSSGRLRRAFEFDGKDGACIVSTTLPFSPATDLLDPSSWERSSVLMWESWMVPPSWGNTTFIWEEGNAVEGPDGSIYDILRVDGQTPRAYNKAVVTRLDTATGNLSFVKMIDFPSCESKFVIRRDPHTRAYFTLSTDVTPEALEIDAIFARNHLVLSTSDDLFQWRFCDTLLTDDTGFTPYDSARFTGFHYVDWVFDGSDIVFAARTGYRGSNTFHNANRMTVKKVTDYVDRCAYLSVYAEVGYGWCRPVDPFSSVGVTTSYSACAQACTAAGPAKCSSFARSDAGQCSLYVHIATNSSGESGVRCFTHKSHA